MKFSRSTDVARVGYLSHLHRKYMSSRRLCRHWSTPCPPPPHTTLRSGRLRHPPTVTSVKGSCGALPGKAWSVQSAEWSATKSVRTSWTRTVCRVSIRLGEEAGVQSWSHPMHFQLLLILNKSYSPPAYSFTQRYTYCPPSHVNDCVFLHCWPWHFQIPQNNYLEFSGTRTK